MVTDGKAFSVRGSYEIFSDRMRNRNDQFLGLKNSPQSVSLPCIIIIIPFLCYFYFDLDFLRHDLESGAPPRRRRATPVASNPQKSLSARFVRNNRQTPPHM
jgi:hypothetical protein